jgi:predicted nucleic acid-binding protein
VPEGLLDQLEDIDRSLEKFPHCDLADASVIALSERYRRLSVVSLDRRHFITYRRADGSPVPMVLPGAETSSRISI